MKRFFYTILIILAAVSCEKQKGIDPPVETAELEVDTNELNFTDDGGSRT